MGEKNNRGQLSLVSDFRIRQMRLKVVIILDRLGIKVEGCHLNRLGNKVEVVISTGLETRSKVVISTGLETGSKVVVILLVNSFLMDPFIQLGTRQGSGDAVDNENKDSASGTRKN